MAEYLNIFWSRGSLDPQVYKTEVKPVEYRGYLLYRRFEHCWDVVRAGKCVGQYAGKSGATGFVDVLLDGNDEAADFKRRRVADLLKRDAA